MIRYVVSFPSELTAEQATRIREQITAAANDRAVRDLVITEGGTLTRRPPTPRIPAMVRRARALAR